VLKNHRMLSIVTLSIYLIVLLCWTECQSFTLLKSARQSTVATVASSKYRSTLLYNSKKDLSLEKRFLKSFLSIGVALTAFSFSSLAIDLPQSYSSEDQSITFKHTDDLVFSPKPLKTHDKEILFKSESIKGFNAGVTVDRVKIDNIRQFADAKGLAQKVVDVEMTKDGVLESIALKWGESKTPISTSNMPAYEIE
jgi:hypothetical protein